MLHSLVYNTTRVLISPSTAETDIWICHHSIAGLFNIPNEEGDYYDERFYLPLSDVRAIEIENGPQGDEGALRCACFSNAERVELIACSRFHRHRVNPQCSSSSR